jgi:uncharacterized membrane protein
MDQALLVGTLWLHNLSTVILIGYYLILALVFLPAFGTDSKGSNIGQMIEQVSSRTRILIIASLVGLIVTGLYLMFMDPGYKSFADLSSTWGFLILAKHVLLVIMIGLGYFTDRAILPAVAKPVKGKPGANPFLNQLKVIVNVLAILGVAILLLTAIAQVL